MCGKLFAPDLSTLEALASELGPTRYVVDHDVLGRLVHPAEKVHVLFDWKAETNFVAMRWGFQPANMYNVRSDEVNKPAWAQSFATNRCVVPAASFIEKGTSFSDSSAECLFIAALWGVTPKSHKFCVALVTMSATATVAAVHRRMPVLLPKREVLNWISPRHHNNAAPMLGACTEYTRGVPLTAQRKDADVLPR